MKIHTRQILILTIKSQNEKASLYSEALLKKARLCLKLKNQYSLDFFSLYSSTLSTIS